MITTLEHLCITISGLSATQVEYWITQEWVRPEGTPGHYAFREIDVARVRLILQLREELHVDDEALPVVLSLMDQLYTARRQMRRLHAAIAAAPEPLRRQLAEAMAEEAEQADRG